MIAKTTKQALVATAALAAGLLAGAGQADAVVYTATYTGQVSSLFSDGTYTSFLDGSDVAPGAAFTAVIRWDDADADPAMSFDAPPLSLHTGPITATLTIGTSSFAFGDHDGHVLYVDAPAGEESSVLHDVDGKFGPGDMFRGALVFYTTGGADLLTSWDWRTPGTYDLTGAAAAGGFVFQEFGEYGLVVGSAGADLTPTSLVIAREGDVSAAPEPAAWALMIIGFGGAGAMLRRRGAQGRAAA